MFGSEPLWKTFWCYGVSGSAVLFALYLVARAEQRLVAEQLLLVVLAIYTVWVLVAIWRCAATSAPIWQMLARNLAVAWAANAALLVLFLQLDLVHRWLEP